MEGETKAEAMHRLRTDGRWAEATEYRNAMREQFKGDGKTRGEAGDLAWAAMIERYPQPNWFNKTHC